LPADHIFWTYLKFHDVQTCKVVTQTKAFKNINFNTNHVQFYFKIPQCLIIILPQMINMNLKDYSNQIDVLDLSSSLRMGRMGLSLPFIHSFKVFDPWIWLNIIPKDIMVRIDCYTESWWELSPYTHLLTFINKIKPL